MSQPNSNPIGAATAAVEAARQQIGVADRHLADALDHLASATEILDGLTASRAERDAPAAPSEGAVP